MSCTDGSKECWSLPLDTQSSISRVVRAWPVNVTAINVLDDEDTLARTSQFAPPQQPTVPQQLTTNHTTAAEVYSASCFALVPLPSDALGLRIPGLLLNTLLDVLQRCRRRHGSCGKLQQARQVVLLPLHAWTRHCTCKTRATLSDHQEAVGTDVALQHHTASHAACQMHYASVYGNAISRHVET